jgi:transposase InsO family protein
VRVTDAVRRVVTRQQSKLKDQNAAHMFPGNIDITAEQLADPLLSKIIEWKLAKITPSEAQLAVLPKDALIYRKFWDLLEVKDGVLLRRLPPTPCRPTKLVVVLPECAWYRYVEACHLEAAHQGRAKTGERVARRCYFPRWRTIVSEVCKKCHVCNAYSRGAPPRQGYMALAEVKCPMDRLAIDLTGPHPPSKRRNIYILTVTDCFSRYLVTVPLKNHFAKTVASALLKYVFCRFGLCREILSDQGTEFNSKLLLSLLSMFGIRKIRTTAYRPQANGRCERAHRDMNSMFAKLIAGDPSDWDIVLDAVTMCYNGSVNRSTGYTPNFLMFGREALTPLDLDFPQVNVEVDYNLGDYVDYVNKLHKALRESYEAARLNSSRAAESRKRTYDATVKPKEFKVGDLVLLRRETVKPGTYRKWSLQYEGPFAVKRKFNDVNYVIKRVPNGTERTVHVDRLRPYQVSSSDSPQPALADVTEQIDFNDGNSVSESEA